MPTWRAHLRVGQERAEIGSVVDGAEAVPPRYFPDRERDFVRSAARNRGRMICQRAPSFSSFRRIAGETGVAAAFLARRTGLVLRAAWRGRRAGDFLREREGVLVAMPLQTTNPPKRSRRNL
jgi:hypothetical protein